MTENRCSGVYIFGYGDNTDLAFFYVLPPIANRRKVSISLDHEWFKNGVRLPDLNSFCEVVDTMLLRRGQSAVKGQRE